MEDIKNFGDSIIERTQYFVETIMTKSATKEYAF